jgi:hypothetical protein
MKPNEIRNVGVIHIVTGKDNGIAPVTLEPGDAVDYVLKHGANQLFRFKDADQVLKIVDSTTGADLSGDLGITVRNNRLTLTIKPTATKAWTGKATFDFDALDDEPVAAGGLDPTIINKGGGG